jgi:hypothetical protein
MNQLIITSIHLFHMLSLCNAFIQLFNDHLFQLFIMCIFFFRRSSLFFFISRVAVGLGWTRARAFNPRVGQGWAHPFCPGGLDGFGFLSGRIDRVRVLVRRDGSDTVEWSTGWIGQAYFFVGRPIRISAHTKSSGREANPRVGYQILFDGLNWTDNSVRRVGLVSAASGWIALPLGQTGPKKATV